MHPTVIKEIITIILLLVFIVMFYWALPPMIYVFAYIAVVAMFTIFIVSLVTITDKDEREVKHQGCASEAGFTTGVAVLLVAIAYQTFVMQSADVWLFIALLAMLIVRLGTRMYVDRNR